MPLDVDYKGLVIPGAYRIDILVEDRVLLELKSVEQTLPIHVAQLLTYLRLADRRVGLLLNFRHKVLKDGITRVAL